jgi:hypothetical protein
MDRIQEGNKFYVALFAIKSKMLWYPNRGLSWSIVFVDEG